MNKLWSMPMYSSENRNPEIEWEHEKMTNWDTVIEEARAFMVLMPEGIQAKHHLWMLWTYAYSAKFHIDRIDALCNEAAQNDSITKADLIRKIIGDGSVWARME